MGRQERDKGRERKSSGRGKEGKGDGKGNSTQMLLSGFVSAQ